ncbi:MAG: SUMF1/EgtB/PvdO family nonheme iron enzyme, partial [Anaerolineales bacterium]|nr:SUMF1/EgtB/PvdO family nonheme iron enzyme [Anaerolineales bacterium]
IDQFEETFTLCLDEEERRAFVNNLLHLMQTPEQRHTVILTMRTDYESHLATMPLLQALFEQNAVRVTAMTAVELYDAILKPAENVGLKFQEGLVDELIREIVGEPAALPLLQFTLLQLWEKRQRNRVTWESFRQLGGVAQALASTADALYTSLIPEEQVTLRRILLRLVQPSEGLEVTRNRIRRKALYQAGEAQDRVDRVLDKLISSRLLHLTRSSSTNDDQVEVAHEALVRNWPRLVEWLDEERVVLRKRLRLTSLAQNWESLGRDADALLRGALLREALEYSDLNELEREFITASQEETVRAEREKEAARLRELEAARQLAEEQKQRAEAEKARAEEQKQRAEAQAVAARRLRQFNVALLFILAIAIVGALLWSNYLQLQTEAETIAAQSTNEALLGSLALATVQAEQTHTAQQVTREVATSQAQSASRATAAAAEAATIAAATATAQYEGALATQEAIVAQATPTLVVTQPVVGETPQPTATPDPLVLMAQLSVQAQLSATVRIQDQMPMLYITGHTFWMGAVDDASAAADETPAHEVTLSNFYIDQYEVSVQQYAAFLNFLGGYRQKCLGFDCVATGTETQFTFLLNNLGFYEPKTGYEQFPANWVTWYGAQA